MQTHFQAGLLEAPTILPQVFLTLFPRSSQHQQNLCTQLPHICALPAFSLLPALPQAPSPHCANVNKNHFRLQPKPSQLPLKISKKIFPQTQKEALSSVSAAQIFYLNPFICAFIELIFIPLTNSVIWNQHLDLFPPQFPNP